MLHPDFVLQPGDVFSVQGKTHILYDNEVKTGGSLAWISNNPGNIRPAGHEAERYGAYVGKQHANFAIFPDAQTGFNAIKSFLSARSSKSITQIMEIYAPRGDGNNDPDAYASTIAKRLGVPVSTIVGSLSDDQLTTFASEIKRVEGWIPGTSYGLDALPDEVWQVLTDPTTPNQPANRPIIRRGDTGEAVRLVQSLLQAKGYDLEIDGIFGPATEAAVKAFQKAANLSVDGIVGPHTWSALSQ
ncbi:peptidoglycan-binding protein [Ktedonobacter robiniae]|uniref:Peptidoglycan binding-like domain-containing protein n=1 Tax=Ktedonobacter robiniae TaxID=2778365 RepID=A0ABQ3V7N8_9CHLR|nr:peptidoglycan-binding protein [Ktedonobacter robiniae]GHO60415.1 hypothetical protein KSB_88900 [Ktedonobacter robiniae]